MHFVSSRMLCLMVCFVSPISLLLGQEKSSNWTQFRGPNGQGISSDKGVPEKWSSKENIHWKTELPGGGTSTPIILGKKVYLTCYSGAVPKGRSLDLTKLKLHLVCINRENGEILWNKEIAPRLPEQETIREDHGYSTNTPVTDGENIYCFFGKTGVIAFDLDGKQLWKTEVGDGLNGWGSAASPILFENLVIVNASVESESLVALDKKTGKEIWSKKGIRESWNTPILITVDNKTELIVAIFGKILGMDPKTGKDLWSCNTDISWYMVPSLVSHEGIIYCVGGRSGGGLAVRAGGKGEVTKSHRVWTIRKGSNVTSPVFHEGHLYWMHENTGTAYCAEAKTGKIVYEERLPRTDQVYGSAVLADGKVYYLTRSGKTLVVAAKPTFELIATNDFGNRERYDSSPSIAGGQIFLRSNRHLYCIGKK
jgi:outer membrane protein assembly factor BamB